MSSANKPKFYNQSSYMKDVTLQAGLKSQGMLTTKMFSYPKVNVWVIEWENYDSEERKASMLLAKLNESKATGEFKCSFSPKVIINSKLLDPVEHIKKVRAKSSSKPDHLSIEIEDDVKLEESKDNGFDFI